MKTLWITACVALGVALQPLPSQAGLLFSAAGGVLWLGDIFTGRTAEVKNHKQLMLYGGGVAVIGGLMWLVGWKTTGTVIMVLDESGSAHPAHDSLMEHLSNRFPEIEDRAVLAQLANEIENSVGTVPENLSVLVRLPKDRVREILDATSLETDHPERWQEIITDFI